jgi:acetyltransferase-like isoleucine patch superfamily enzyme
MRIYFELLWIFLRRKIFMFAPNAMRIRMLRADGVKIGERCLVHTPYFSTEPYLIEIGDDVAISSGTEFITHDATGFIFRKEHPNMGLFGTIHVGNRVFFGLKCMILPNTRIGSNCVIGAGSVVRGIIPDDSVVFGNPAQVIMKTPMLKKLLLHSRGRLETHLMSSPEKRRALRKHFGLD